MISERQIYKQIAMTEDKLKQYMESRGHKASHDSFKVPEGYFDTLCDRVMQQLPEKKPIRRTLIPWIWQYAAVAVVGVIVCATLVIPHFRQESDDKVAKANVVQEIEQAYYDDEYISDALDYAMVDNNEIALYLTEIQ